MLCIHSFAVGNHSRRTIDWALAVRRLNSSKSLHVSIRLPHYSKFTYKAHSTSNSFSSTPELNFLNSEVPCVDAFLAVISLLDCCLGKFRTSSHLTGIPTSPKSRSRLEHIGLCERIEGLELFRIPTVTPSQIPVSWAKSGSFTSPVGP